MMWSAIDGDDALKQPSRRTPHLVTQDLTMTIRKLSLLSAWILNSALLVLCSPLSSFASDARFVYVATGRVVDDKNKPVPGVTVSVKSAHHYEGDIIDHDETDSNGKFTIQKKSDRQILDWRIYASYSSAPENTDELLNVHVGTAFCGEYYKSLCGDPVRLIENKITNIGDIRLKIRQYPLLVRLHDLSGNPLVSEESEFSPWWRVRDPLGDVIGEGGNAPVHLRVSESAVMIALPAGKWTLEISDDNGSAIGGRFDVKAGPYADIQNIDLRLGSESYRFEGRRSTSRDGRREACKAISKRGFRCTESAFRRRVLLGNHELVDLYLRAGFDPNILTADDNALTSALDRPKVLKLLLEAGANVNGRVDRGFTPLLQAVGWDVIPKETIQMLLDAGADINAKADDGRTVFELAEDRDEIRELLEQHRRKTPN